MNAAKTFLRRSEQRTLRITGRPCAALAAALALFVPSSAQAGPPRSSWSALLPGLTMAYDPLSQNACTAGRASCVQAVIREMRHRWRPPVSTCDHDAIFALSYLRTTEEYRRAIKRPAFFEDTRFVNHEDAVFARFYFEAADGWQAGRRAEVPPAWAIAMQAADDHTMSAAGDLALGINAHVQRDLPFVLAGIGLVKPDGSSRKEDHDRVNQILRRVNPKLISEIARRFDPVIDDRGDEADQFQIIVAWREIAWHNAERLATARTAQARAAVTAEIESYAASQAELIRRSAAYPSGGQGSAARDAYCSAHAR